MFFQLRKVTLSIVLEEHRIRIAGRVSRGGESNQNIYVSIVVEIIDIQCPVHLNVLEQDLLPVRTVAVVNECLQFGSRIDKVHKSIVVQVRRVHLTSCFKFHPFTISHVIINDALCLIYKIHPSVGIHVDGFGRRGNSCSYSRGFLYTTFRTMTIRQRYTGQERNGSISWREEKAIRIRRIRRTPCGRFEFRQIFLLRHDIHSLFKERTIRLLVENIIVINTISSFYLEHIRSSVVIKVAVMQQECIFYAITVSFANSGAGIYSAPRSDFTANSHIIETTTVNNAVAVNILHKSVRHEIVTLPEIFTWDASERFGCKSVRVVVNQPTAFIAIAVEIIQQRCVRPYLTIRQSETLMAHLKIYRNSRRILTQYLREIPASLRDSEHQLGGLTYPTCVIIGCIRVNLTGREIRSFEAFIRSPIDSYDSIGAADGERISLIHI